MLGECLYHLKNAIVGVRSCLLWVILFSVPMSRAYIPFSLLSFLVASLSFRPIAMVRSQPWGVPWASVMLRKLSHHIVLSTNLSSILTARRETMSWPISFLACSMSLIELLMPCFVLREGVTYHNPRSPIIYVDCVGDGTVAPFAI
jgi:hypothetical protein